MGKIVNEAGREIDFDAAAALMDRAITLLMERHGEYSEQEYFNVYCERHRRAFREEFEPNKANPVW